jgi:AcrR family transcriptional regulator
MNIVYGQVVPKLWNETIEAHRRSVRDAILHATVALADEHGVRSVTMSQIAEQAGIGRATLYKYFPDVEAILHAWHGAQINAHLGRLAEARDRAGDGDRVAAVLEAYARVMRETRTHHGTELATVLHQDQHVADAQRRLHGMIRDLLADAAQAGTVRGDVTPDELATYCLHALGAAGVLPSKTAVRRLVTVTLAGLRPSSG